MKVVILLALLALAFHKSRQQCLTSNDNQLPNPKGKLGLYTGQQAFSLALLQAINQPTPTENLFFSPYSTYHALLLAYFISSNQTEHYLKKTLQLDASQTKLDVFAAYKLDKYATELRASKSAYEFNNANRIYVGDQINVRKCLTRMFDEELRKTEFARNLEAARSEINTWVENRTYNTIKDLLPLGAINNNTNLIFVNAAYFKGVWENKFDPAQTAPDVFYITPSKPTTVDVMHLEGTFQHEVCESLKAHILELKYEGNDISMFILLPTFTKEDGVETVLKRLTTEKLKNIVEGGTLAERTVKVSLPKFSLEHTLELVPILESLGVGNLFRNDADLSLLSGNPGISVGEAIHKAKIEVDESGTKAAGATSFFTWRMGNDDVAPIVFNCNRPFLFFLYNKRMHTVLFSGIFRQPP